MATPVDVVSAIRTNTSELGVAKEKLNAINEAVSSEMKLRSDAIAGGTVTGTSGKPTTPLAEQQELSAKLAEQAANQRRGNTIDYENHSNDLLLAIKEHSAMASAKKQEIVDINNSSNPLDHIMGLVTIPFKAAQAAGSEELAKSKLAELTAINTQMQSSAKTTAEIQTRVTESTNASVVQAVTNDQIAEASKAKIQALQTDAHGINAILNLNEQQMRNKIKEFDIGEAVEMRALKKEQIASMIDARQQAAEDRAENKADRATQREELKAARKVPEQLIDLINVGLLANGKEMIPEEKRALMASQLKATGPMGDLLRTLAEQGMQTAMEGKTAPQGANPTEAAEFRNQIQYAPHSESEKHTLSIVEGLMGNKSVTDIKDKVGRVNAANEAVRSKLAKDQEDISTASNSLARPASYETLGLSEALRNNRVFKEIIAPQITDNISSTSADPTDLFKRLGTAVAKKQATIDEMVDVLHLYAGVSVMTNNTANGVHKLTGYKQTKFRAHLPQPKSRLKLFDLTVPNITPHVGGALVGAAINQIKPSHQMKSVDFLNQTELYNAAASYVSGELKD